MKKMTVFAVALAALSAFAASKSATESWVSNYVASVAVLEDASYAHFDGTNFIFTASTGETCVYPVRLVETEYDQTALYCFESTFAGVSRGDIFAYDTASNCYRNASISSPARLDVSSYTRSNGTNEVVLTWTNATTHLAFDSAQRNASEWMVAVTSNRYALGYFRLRSATITRLQARQMGVTNATTSVTMGVGDFLRAVFAPRAFADGTSSSIPDTPCITVTLEFTINNWGTTGSGGGSDVFTYEVCFFYNGLYAMWPDPDDEHYYFPGYWPTEGDWKNGANWTKDQDPITYQLPVYNKKQSTWFYDTATMKLATFEKKYGTVASRIPAYSAPVLCKYEKSVCERKGHNWNKCKCTACSKCRAHSPERVGATSTECDRCSNLDGWENESSENKKRCDSTKRMGGDESLLTTTDHHYGWHHMDGVPGSQYWCVCSCGDYAELVAHTPDETAVRTYAQGKYDPETRSVIEDSADNWHHYTLACNRAKGNGSTCGSLVVYNEHHNWSDEVGTFSAWHWVGTEKVDCATTASDADVDTHHATSVTCDDCGYTASDYLAHVFPGGDNDAAFQSFGTAANINLCTCKDCGLVHHVMTSWACGAATVSGCPRCNTRASGSCRAAIDYTSHSEQLAHGYIGDQTAEGHRCACGKVFAPHWKNSKDDEECAVCGWPMPRGEDGTTSVTISITNGVCGAWEASNGVTYGGGMFPIKDGLPLSTSTNYPSEHFYDWRTIGCKACTNYNPTTGAACGHISYNLSDHAGWHNFSNRCVCSCGAMTNYHHYVATNVWRQIVETVHGTTVTNCQRKHVCITQNHAKADDLPCLHEKWENCEHDFYGFQTPQYGDLAPDEPWNMNSCGEWMKCNHDPDNLDPSLAQCGLMRLLPYGYGWREVNLGAHTTGVVRVYQYDGESHILSNHCDRCGKSMWKSQAHGMSVVSNWSETAGIAGFHKYWTQRMCVTNGETLGCGFTTNTYALHRCATKYVSRGALGHVQSNICNSCTFDDPFVSEVEDHTFSTTATYVNELQHKQVHVCSQNCGYGYEGETTAHTFVCPDHGNIKSGYYALGHYCYCKSPAYSKPCEFLDIYGNELEWAYNATYKAYAKTCRVCGFVLLKSDENDDSTLYGTFLGLFLYGTCPYSDGEFCGMSSGLYMYRNATNGSWWLRADPQMN